MCRSGAPCGCSSTGLPVGVWLAVVAVAGLVSAAASVLTTILVAVAVAGLCVAGVVVGFAVWRVRVLTRPGPRPAVHLRERRAAITSAQVAPRVRELPRPPLALEAARPQAATVAAERGKVRR